MLNFFRQHKFSASDSKLFDQQTFYEEFKKDLESCGHEAIIESPFITTRRTGYLLPVINRAVRRGVRVVVNTRDPYETSPYDAFAVDAIAELQSIGVEVFYTGRHHRKLAIFDRLILWEGSLNILSQNDSCEVMRRIHSSTLAKEMVSFIELDKII